MCIRDRTGVYNRREGYRLISDLIDRSNEEELCFSLCYLDIDDLKKVNDALGHLAGDDLITSICSIVSAGIGDEDIMSRFGGDEFVVTFINKSEIEVENEISKMISKLEKQNKSGKKEFRMSFSYGIIEYCQIEHYELDELIEKADEKMYKYKSKSKAKR